MNWIERKENAEKRGKLNIRFTSGKIKMLRNVLGLSQNEFSQIVGVHQSQLSKWEKGDKIRDIVALEKMNEVFEKYKTDRIAHLQAEINFLQTF